MLVEVECQVCDSGEEENAYHMIVDCVASSLIY